jgi:hypothetical protein
MKRKRKIALSRSWALELKGQFLGRPERQNGEGRFWAVPGRQNRNIKGEEGRA